jgi:predicted Ser/Thr protein kinase
MAQFFNNKNLKFLGKGKGGGEVLGNNKYAYKFVKSANKKALEDELKFTLRAAKIGVAPPIDGSEIKKVAGGNEWVMRIKMKKLKGDLEDYARNVVGGEAATDKLGELVYKLNKIGGICHNDLKNKDNIMHDGNQLYIIDYSEATTSSSICEDILAVQQIKGYKMWKTISGPLNSPARPFRSPKRFRTPTTGTPRSPRSPNTGTPRTPRSPNGTPRTPRSPNTGTPRTPRSPNGTPRSGVKRPRRTPPLQRTLF